MKIGKIKDKITEVWVAACAIVRRCGHTKKFAKHIVAFTMKQTEGFTDEKLAEFLGKDPV